MLKDDLSLIVRGARKGNYKSLVLFGSYGKGEGALHGGIPVNDLDLLLVDADKDAIDGLNSIVASVPLDVILIDSKEIKETIPTQMMWEIRYGSILLDGEPLDLPYWKAYEIPYMDAMESLDKRSVSMIIAKHEMMKENPDWDKVMTQIGKAVIAIGDAILIKRGRFDHRYAVRNLLLMHDEIAKDYKVAVSHKILGEPELTPDDIWNMWKRTRANLRDYVINNELIVPNLELLLQINETTTQEEVAESIKVLGAGRFL